VFFIGGQGQGKGQGILVMRLMGIVDIPARTATLPFTESSVGWSILISAIAATAAAASS
jgi:hypothetical protein